jgi:hypothetical protein
MMSANVWKWHIASVRCGAEFGRYRGAQPTLVKPATNELDL